MAKIAAAVEEKFTQSLKSKDTKSVSILRLAKSALVNERIDKGHELSDAEEIQVLRREVKKREDAAGLYEQGGDSARAAAEREEAQFLQNFLPAEMSDEDIAARVKEAVSEVGADNFGKLMGAVMKKVAGSASGDRVSKILKEELEKQK